MPLLCRSYIEALSPHKVKPLLTKASAISCPNARHQSTSSAPSSSDQVIFSGIQPTGVPHLGNYLGALKQWVHLQNTVSPSTKLFYSVVDWHAGTTPYNPRQLRIWKRETLATLLAVGLDESRCVMFHQSSVPHHLEMEKLLSWLASMGYLSRMTQWKSKLSLTEDAKPFDRESKAKLKHGLFSYPILQAADILVHRATHVPVGEDQSQHLEFARECVTNFNNAFGSHLVHPQTILSPAKRVMSLQEPHLKMSKSHADPRSRIVLTDSADEIHRKIMAALTDSTNSVSYNPKERPGVSNLMQLWSHFDPEGRSPEDLAITCRGMNLRTFKTKVSDAIAASLEPVRTRFAELMAEDGGEYIDFVAKQGTIKARENAEATMKPIREAAGLEEDLYHM